MTDHVQQEPNLDPEDWESFRRLGHRMVDDLTAWLSGLGDRPVWQPMPADVRDRLTRQPLPLRGRPADEVYEEYRRDVMPYPWGNSHPRFWGWVAGGGIPSAALADLLASGVDSNAGAFDQSSTLVEDQVLDWLKEMLGFPPETSGILTSGCSIANIIALAAARSAQAPGVREHGLTATGGRLKLYGSVEIHTSVVKAVELLGFGRDALELVPVDAQGRVRLDDLERRIEADRAAGDRPSCLIGSAGGVNTGAIDDLTALADIAGKHGMWLHVDGAFGALAWLSPEMRGPLAGLQRADSLAFDLHKWMYMNFDVGGVFIRDEADHRRAFEHDACYLGATTRGPAARVRNTRDYGLELTRPFRGLKVWMALKEHGADHFARLVEQNLRQARYLADRVALHERLELSAPVPLNVVCFRYVAPGVSAERLDELNRDIVGHLHESGLAMPSYTTVGGAFVIRAAVTNHRSRIEDFDFLVDEVVRCGDELCASANPGEPA